MAHQIQFCILLLLLLGLADCGRFGFPQLADVQWVDKILLDQENSHSRSSNSRSGRQCDAWLTEIRQLPGKWSGYLDILVTEDAHSWTLELTFDTPLLNLQSNNADVSPGESKKEFVLSSKIWNGLQKHGDQLLVEIIYRYSQKSADPFFLSSILNNRRLSVCYDLQASYLDFYLSTTTFNPIEDTTVTENTVVNHQTQNLPYVESAIDFDPNFGKTKEVSSTEYFIEVSCNESPYNYTEVLHKSLLFYEAQRSGPLPDSQRVTWRTNSALTDAICPQTKKQIDLTGGYYDGGDFIKFGFPMAASTTLLAWGAIDYASVYENAGEMENIKDAVKWATDYFIKAHIAPNVLYGQVGDSELDHSYWGRPEDMTMPRPAFKITTEKPGSDLAGETAAALAAASILFTESDANYSASCLEHAKQLYTFAEKYRGNYSDSIPDAAKYYKSWSGHMDELAWAAAWLYRATNNSFYLNASQTHFNSLDTHPNDFSWDDKTAGVQVLLSKLTKNETYLNMAKSFCDDMLYNRPRTPKGLLFISKWGALRYAANSAYICLQIGNTGNNKSVYYNFSRKQIDYMLGSTGQSYVIGFGQDPPKRPNHRSSSCANAPAPCNWDTFGSHEPNANVLYGALVGGPDINDNYEDKRSNYISNKVSLDFNAAFQGAVAALMQYEDC